MGKVSQYICLIIILLILPSCRNKPLSNVNFSNGSYKLYFITPQIDSAFYQPNKFQAEHKNFFISNNKALEIIQRNIIKERVKKEPSFNSFYKLRLTNNSKTIIDGGVLDIKNNILLYHNGNYHFDFDKFLELEKEFVELNAYEVNFITAWFSPRKIGQNEFEISKVHIFAYIFASARNDQRRPLS